MVGAPMLNAAAYGRHASMFATTYGPNAEPAVAYIGGSSTGTEGRVRAAHPAQGGRLARPQGRREALRGLHVLGRRERPGARQAQPEQPGARLHQRPRLGPQPRLRQGCDGVHARGEVVLLLDRHRLHGQRGRHDRQAQQHLALARSRLVAGRSPDHARHPDRRRPARTRTASRRRRAPRRARRPPRRTRAATASPRKTRTCSRAPKRRRPTARAAAALELGSDNGGCSVSSTSSHDRLGRWLHPPRGRRRHRRAPPQARGGLIMNTRYLLAIALAAAAAVAACGSPDSSSLGNGGDDGDGTRNARPAPAPAPERDGTGTGTDAPAPAPAPAPARPAASRRTARRARTSSRRTCHPGPRGEVRELSRAGRHRQPRLDGKADAAKTYDLVYLNALRRRDLAASSSKGVHAGGGAPELTAEDKTKWAQWIALEVKDGGRRRQVNVLEKFGTCFDKAKFDAIGFGQLRTTRRQTGNNTQNLEREREQLHGLRQRSVPHVPLGGRRHRIRQRDRQPDPPRRLHVRAVEAPEPGVHPPVRLHDADRRAGVQPGHHDEVDEHDGEGEGLHPPDVQGVDDDAGSHPGLRRRRHREVEGRHLRQVT